SPSSRAMQLIDGAQAIAGDLPRASSATVDVPMEAGEALDTGVLRFSALHRIHALIQEQLAGGEDHVLVVGGDCGVSVAAIARAAAHSPGLAVVWLDAHGDLHTPESSPSGAFSGMSLRAILGDGAEGLALTPGAIAPTRVVLAGARDIEPAEDEFIAQSGIVTVTANDLVDHEVLAAAVQATGATSVYVHVDLDVLDPAAMTGVTASVPFGVSVPDLVAAIGALRAAMPLAGASLTGFAPSSAASAVDDLGAILRIVGALA
ncbi:MAG: arginase family protein, partial [Actinobacteria bacterium]|nr:arginase family protein [Actinomycetota bacterium]